MTQRWRLKVVSCMPHHGTSEGELLHRMGRDGWELVAVLPSDHPSVASRLYFKRLWDDHDPPEYTPPEYPFHEDS